MPLQAMARPDDFNPEDDGEGLESGLVDEPISLLDFLTDQGELRKAYSGRYPGFPTA